MAKSTDDMDGQPGHEETAKLLLSLWQATPEALVSKLPRGVGDKAARKKEHCNECGGYHERPSIHLDYLGHADTCRLLAAVDPFWQWEPKGGWTATGEPVFIRDSQGYPTALWISLTVLGVTRPGIGTVDRGKSDPEKELVGDAIRNAAMRFGVGADLWSKAKGGGLDDSPDSTFTRGTPPPESPDAWFERNGWDNKAEHDAWRKSRLDALRREKEDNPEDHATAVKWCEEHKLDWRAAVPRLLADDFDAFMIAAVAKPEATAPEMCPGGCGFVATSCRCPDKPF